MSEKQFLEQSLWHNSLVRIDNCPIFYREWFHKGVNNCDYESFAAKLAKCQRANKLVYTKLISIKSTHPTHNQQKWLKDCHQNDVDSINWRDAYQLASKYTKSTKILEFQYKFLHRRIATNDFLTRIGVRDNPNCSFCDREQEKLLHLFWACPKVASF